MSGAAQQVPKFSDVRELVILRANLLDTAQQLPRGQSPWLPLSRSATSSAV